MGDVFDERDRLLTEDTAGELKNDIHKAKNTVDRAKDLRDKLNKIREHADNYKKNANQDLPDDSQKASKKGNDGPDKKDHQGNKSQDGQKDGSSKGDSGKQSKDVPKNNAEAGKQAGKAAGDTAQAGVQASASAGASSSASAAGSAAGAASGTAGASAGAVAAGGSAAASGAAAGSAAGPVGTAAGAVIGTVIAFLPKILKAIAIFYLVKVILFGTLIYALASAPMLLLDAAKEAFYDTWVGGIVVDLFNIDTNHADDELMYGYQKIEDNLDPLYKEFDSKVSSERKLRKEYIEQTGFNESISWTDIIDPRKLSSQTVSGNILGSYLFDTLEAYVLIADKEQMDKIGEYRDKYYENLQKAEDNPEYADRYKEYAEYYQSKYMNKVLDCTMFEEDGSLIGILGRTFDQMNYVTYDIQWEERTFTYLVEVETQDPETGEKIITYAEKEETVEGWALYATVHRLTVDDYDAIYHLTEGQKTDRNVFWETINSVNADIGSLKVDYSLLRRFFSSGFNYKDYYRDPYIDTLSNGFLTSTDRLVNAKAIDYVSKHIGSPYSNEYRMSDGYYDCSSLVWRAYKDMGFNIGDAGSWAPTAAEQARWFIKGSGSSHCKVLYDRTAEKNNHYCSGKLPSLEALQPGDIIFYRHRSTNDAWYRDYGPQGENRYRLIDHMSMIFFSSSVEKGADADIDGTWIMQARYTENGGVTVSSFTYRQSDIELIIRPIK